ncbi:MULTISPECIES: CaiB/BaiF CoA transferase family protein [Paracoccus]|uniref:Alpha-methylacyl-CoA racemase n=1 Tax=Paracoccus versutus TaxID=34007 RepID=A0A3D9XP88_PARVE|nr:MULTISPECIES: CaiB/BaiF CoA-transferase family protein [Paracoccus]REF68709.1 alpha-methylacyl-CoA racemase [Paracoccus versutus]WGR56887.1 CoA transferase [Paracoccus versutus]
MTQAKGPLAGVRIVLLGGIGPSPFCGALLSDLGADVVRIDRLTATDGGLPVDPRFNLLNRGQRSIAMDLKKPEAIAAVMRLVAGADAAIEGFRPGAAERLGIGPDACLAVNPRLVYGRMTGWGQDGPLAQEPGHDINYISLTGVLHAIGRAGEAPVPPLNLAGDFGGGSLYLALGLLSGIIEARRSGKGQVVDAAMVDGSASLMGLIYGIHAAGYWQDRRGVNRLDGGAPFYNVYETADGRHVSIGANEERFYANAVRLLGLEDAGLPDQHDQSGWPLMREKFAQAFKTRTRDEWVALAAGKEACITPVLSLSEAPQAPHLRARGTFVEVEGVTQPAPAPRFSRTPGAIQRPPARPGQHSDEILGDWGFSAAEIDGLRRAAAVG